MSVMVTTRLDIKDVLMEPREVGVKDAYFIIPEEDQSIIVISPGKNGMEFNKTAGLFHRYQGVLLLQCLYGQGVVVMQRDGESAAKEFKVVTLHSGRQVAVPAGFGHGIVNIGKTFLVVLNNTSADKKNYSDKEVKAKHGFAYYIVEKKGEVSFEQNPNYTMHPQITTE